ncbi:MAG: hypothetical protein U0353_34760 [Sandaracinus sp.]|jgi:hypothetical protein
MGLLATRWEAEFEGHHITVSRNEVLRGFNLEWDGREIARRAWSFVGLGELHGTAEHEGKQHAVHVSLEWAGGINDGNCRITVDGTPLEVKHIY